MSPSRVDSVDLEGDDTYTVICVDYRVMCVDLEG